MKKEYICKSCGYTSNSTKDMHIEMERSKTNDKQVVISYYCNKCAKERE